jgi:hypothetical protein
MVVNVLSDKLKLNFKVEEARNTQMFNGQRSFSPAFTVVENVYWFYINLRTAFFLYLFYFFMSREYSPNRYISNSNKALNCMFLATTLKTRL